MAEPRVSYSDSVMVITEAVMENVPRNSHKNDHQRTKRTNKFEHYSYDERINEHEYDYYGTENDKGNDTASRFENQAGLTNSHNKADSDIDGDRQCVDHIFDESGENNNHNETISDHDSSNSKTDTDMEESSIKTTFPGTGNSSGRTSRSSGKMELVKSRRPSVYYDAHITSVPTSLDYLSTTRENVVESFVREVGEESFIHAPKNGNESSRNVSFLKENSVTQYLNNTGHKYVENDTAEGGVGVCDLEDTLDTFSSDTITNVGKSKGSALETTLFKTVNNESGEKNSNKEYSRGDLNSEVGESDKINTTNSKGCNNNRNMMKHEHANNDQTESSLKQIKCSGTFRVGREDDNASAHSKSTLSSENFHTHIDMSSKPTNTQRGDSQNGSTSDLRDNSRFSPGEKHNTQGPAACESDDLIHSNRQDICFNESSDKELQQSMTGNITDFTNKVDEENTDIVEEAKETRAIILQTHPHRASRKKKSENNMNKNLSANTFVKSSKSASSMLSNKSCKQINYEAIIEMKAIDRLLKGPYSKSLSENMPSPRSRTYDKETKSSSVKIKKEQIWSKVKEIGLENGISKTHIPQKRTSASSVRKTTVYSSQNSSAKSKEGKSTTINTNNDLKNKHALNKNNKSAVRASKRKHDQQLEAETSISTKEPCFHSEEHHHKATPSIVATQEVNLEAVNSSSVELNNSVGAQGETIVHLDDTTTSKPEVPQLINRETPIEPEKHKNENNLQNSQKEVQQIVVSNVSTVVEKRKVPEKQNQKKDKKAIIKKPTTLREWFKSKKKMKESSPKLVKNPGSKYWTGQKNEKDQSVDITNILITTTQEKHTMLEPTVEEPKQLSVAEDPPASVIIVDETPPTETTEDSQAGQVILNGLLQASKTKTMSDNTNSTTQLPLNSPPGSPLPESILANGFNKMYERVPPKSVSIQSLTVPGLLHNTFPGETALDEDTISIYSRRDSMRQSFDSMSRKSVDYRIRNTALVVLPIVDDKPKSVFTNDESFIKNAIPFLPVNLAVLCLILNIAVPGSGTALSGLSILCCGQPRLSNKDDQILITLCANCVVGLAQLFTVTFLLVGWFWSIGWGVQMVMLSVKHEKEMKEQRSKELQSLALSALGSPKRPAMFEL